MPCILRNILIFAALLVLAVGAAARAEVCNLKIVTDASPDYSDLPSMVRGITANWQTPREKCWAIFYWNHIARRQTAPMHLHGMDLTDPIRQFNDYGFTMCSTISGINQSIWEQLGMKHRYWDISNHTVAEVFYDGRWHMYDNSLSALYTLCDGKTLAGVEDIGKDGACEKSGGKVERGHIAKYHCLTSTSPNGFLSGADTARSLDEESRCFNPNGLKNRTYFYDWDNGHRYILNLFPGAVYTRYYHSLGNDAALYVPNPGGKRAQDASDPESRNPRYHLRGNGVWEFTPSLKPDEYKQAAHGITGSAIVNAEGIRPANVKERLELIYKLQSANVTTGLTVDLTYLQKPVDGDSWDGTVHVYLSVDNGKYWKDIWNAELIGEHSVSLDLHQWARGSYEPLIKVALYAQDDPSTIVLKRLKLTAHTELNSKTQPRLNIGRNTIYVGAGDQTDSIVFWPELQADKYKEQIIDEKNVVSEPKHPGYLPVLHPDKPKEDGYVVYRIDAPRDLTKLTFGGRFYNRVAKSHIDLLWSLDGQTWTKSWSLTDNSKPWDVIHYETVAIPAGHKSVRVKYLMNSAAQQENGCGIYALRIEANHQPVSKEPRPLEVTFTWKEPQKARSLVERSHTQVIEMLPFTYTIDVGGEDHPRMESLTVNLAGARGPVKAGYSDGKRPADGAAKWVGVWETPGKNLAIGKSYTLSAPSADNWGAGDDGKKLTDGVVGPPYSGGISYRYGAIWKGNTDPLITLDLGSAVPCASFGLNFHGYPMQDALKGKIADKVEVLVSDDGKAFRSIGFVNTDWHWKDVPVNHMWTDEETANAGTFRLVPDQPVTARFVQYKVTSGRFFCVTELEVLDKLERTPFDLKIALP